MTTTWSLSPASTEYIVTGDNDLLEWPEQRSPALTPAAFAELVGE